LIRTVQVKTVEPIKTLVNFTRSCV